MTDFRTQLPVSLACSDDRFEDTRRAHCAGFLLRIFFRSCAHMPNITSPAVGMATEDTALGGLEKFRKVSRRRGPRKNYGGQGD